MNREQHINELIVQVSHLAGFMEARGEIEGPDFEELTSVTGEIIAQYEMACAAYWKRETDESPNLDTIAENILKDYFSPSPSPDQSVITLFVNNEQKIKLFQNAPDRNIIVKTMDSDDSTVMLYNISPGDLVTMLNWYRYQKEHGNPNLTF